MRVDIPPLPKPIAAPPTAGPVSADDAATLISLLDLTSLQPTDTAASVAALARRGAKPGKGVPPVAGICVYSDLIGPVAEALADRQPQPVAVIGGFPHGRVPTIVTVTEAEMAVAAGARELDMVLDRGLLTSGDTSAAAAKISAVKAAVGPGIFLKVILETGELGTADAIWAASWTALNGGADYLKTSTGMTPVGANDESVTLLTQAVVTYEEQTGMRVGLKASGGVRDPQAAARYLAIVKELAPEWVNAALFRIGASSLLDALLPLARS